MFKGLVLRHQVCVWLAITSHLKTGLFLCFRVFTSGRVHLDVC